MPTRDECLDAAADIYGAILADPDMAEILRDPDENDQRREAS